MDDARELRPTAEQQLAIDLYAPYLLVSASAGTGKTKTLVDKVLAALRAGQRLDRLLVITFTQKAAQQLKEKLFEELARQADLRPQRYLLPQAYISTIDAFCGRLLRENAVAVHLDPGFRILPEPEDRLMLAEILDDLFHHWYRGRAPAASASGSSWRQIPPPGDPIQQEFLRLVDLCGYRQGREGLKEEIEGLLARARVHPDPEAFVAALEGGLRAAEVPYLASLDEAIRVSWTRGCALLGALLDYAAGRFPKGDFSELSRLQDALASALPEAEAAGAGESAPPPDPAALLTTLRRHLEAAGFHDRRGPWNLRVPKAPYGTGKYLKPFLKRVEAWLGARGSRGAGGPLTWLPDPPEADAEQYRRTHQTLQTLLTLLRQTMERYAHRKRDEGFLDFSDLELASRRLLQQAPAAVRRRFDLVLVDEFQDINRLQADIIAGFEPTRGRFLVGDTKQCIYQFRLSDPGIFRDYFTAAACHRPGAEAPRELSPETTHARLFLSHNFRSRYPILAVVNEFFAELLNERMIGGRYADEALRFSATQGLAPEAVRALPAGPARWGGREASPKAARHGPGFAPVEIHLIARPPSKRQAPPDDGTIREARFVARRIHELVSQGFPVYDEQQKHWRAARFRDIAILLRSPGASGAVVARELRAAGIPTLFGVQGFFERQEIRDAVNLLHVLDNAEDDIALAGILRAPFASFEDGDLVRVRLAWPESASLLAALQATATGEPSPWSGPPAPEHPPSTELTGKSDEFLKALEAWRRLIQRSDLPAALATIMEASGLMAGAAGDAGGPERVGNLAQLLALTRTYCRERGHSLPGLVRYLGAIENSGRGPDPVVTATGASEAVQILSLHKAKGLEFPIVFLSLLGRAINFQDLRKRILTGETWLGVDAFEPREYVRTPTAARRLLAWHRRGDLIEEELRILYVAFTRAREKLVMTGQLASGWDQLLQQLVVWQSPAEVREALIYGAHRPLDWLLGLLARRGVLARLTEPGDRVEPDPTLIVARHPHDPVASTAEAMLPAGPGVPAAPADAEAGGAPTDREAAAALLGRLARDLARTYPHQAATQSRGKYWATEIKRLADLGVTAEEREAGSALLWETSPGKPPGTEGIPRPGAAGTEDEALKEGSRLHAILEILDLTHPEAEQSVSRAVQELVRRGALPPDWNRAARRGQHLQPILRFLDSPWAAEMRAAGKTLEREATFSLRLAPRELAPIWPAATELQDDEWFLIQGQIDALWRRGDGRWVILDFKSDRVSSPREIAARAAQYRPQMLLYREAVTRLWRAEEVECILYFLRPGEALPIPADGQG